MLLQLRKAGGIRWWTSLRLVRYRVGDPNPSCRLTEAIAPQRARLLDHRFAYAEEGNCSPTCEYRCSFHCLAWAMQMT